MSKVVVIGGGPSGMMAAIKASEKYEVVLIEKNEKLGKKMYITGKGRCNITNAKDINDFFDYIPGNPNFLYSSLYSFTNADTIDFFQNRGCTLKKERGDRVFPNSDKSSDIIKVMAEELTGCGVEVILNTRVSNININNSKIKNILTEKGDIIEGDYFIICTGGLSYPQTGSTGDGYKFAKAAGHNVIKPLPSLVPIETEEEWIKELQGLSLKNVELSLINGKNKVLYSEFGEMLFTHFGISGPIVLSASRFVNYNRDLKAVINLKPSLTSEELYVRINRDFLQLNNKDFKNSLANLLPHKLIDIIILLSGIDPNKKVNSITKEERKKLVDLLQNFTLKIRGLRPIDEAIITVGGVSTKEIDPSTMKSKIINNLYFSGEVIDVDGYTGGYNLQIALSTGFLAGIKIGQ